MIKEFQRLKEAENDAKKIEWDAKKNNVRDFASINELTVLSNLETHNAQMIREGRNKTERFQILKDIAEYQVNILNAAEQIKLIEEISLFTLMFNREKRFGPFYCKNYNRVD